jgi:hypothetical protein
MTTKRFSSSDYRRTLISGAGPIAHSIAGQFGGSLGVIRRAEARNALQSNDLGRSERLGSAVLTFLFAILAGLYQTDPNLSIQYTLD